MLHQQLQHLAYVAQAEAERIRAAALKSLCEGVGCWLSLWYHTWEWAYGTTHCVGLCYHTWLSLWYHT